MTVNLFIFLVTVLSIVSSLITEAIKKIIETDKPTVIVAIISAIVGWAGGAAAYILVGIPFTTISIVCLILLAPVIWLVATLGYDKVIEAIKEITNI